MIANSRFTVAIHILTALAYNADSLMTSAAIAGSVNTNPVVIRRSLGDLRRAKLVTSQPGNRGGWRLSRSPETITLRDVYEASQHGELFAGPPGPPNAQCPIGQTICAALAEFYAEAEGAMKSQLAGRSIADVLARLRLSSSC